MTWSIYHQADFDTSSDYGLFWEYHFNTFLPTRGWTTTQGVPPGGSLTTSGYEVFQCSKTFTLPDATTVTKFYVYHMRTDFAQVTIYEWDGVNFGNSSQQRNTPSNMGTVWGLNATRECTWLVSDESTDAWIMFTNNNAYIAAAELPHAGWLGAEMPDWAYPSSTSSVAGEAAFVNGQQMQFHLGDSILGGQYLLTNSFLYSYSTAGSLTYSYNTLNDLYMKFNGTTNAQITMYADGASSVLVDGTYYLDLRPNSQNGFMLETGNTDLGVL